MDVIIIAAVVFISFQVGGLAAQHLPGQIIKAIYGRPGTTKEKLIAAFIFYVIFALISFSILITLCNTI